MSALLAKTVAVLVLANGVAAAEPFWHDVLQSSPLNTLLLVALALITRQRGHELSQRIEKVDQNVNATAETASSAALAAGAAAEAATEACRVAKSIAAPLRYELAPPAPAPRRRWRLVRG